jgi:O-antigen/teichoic acid export membrane protein
VRFALPSLRLGRRAPRDVLRGLFAFGSWVAATNVLNPLIGYLDRFMLAGLAGVAALSFYVPVYEAALRLLLVPGSVATSLFPVVSSLSARGQHETVATLYSAAIRNIALVLLPPIAFVIAFAPDLLRFWLGEDYVLQSATALRLLSAGMLLNAVAHIPYSYLHALGRPDISARVLGAELLFHVPIAWWLVSHFGVAGAAGAWGIRASADCVILMVVVWRVLHVSPRPAFVDRLPRILMAIAALGLGSLAASMTSFSPVQRLGVFLTGALVFTTIVWRGVLDATDRTSLIAALGARRMRASST